MSELGSVPLCPAMSREAPSRAVSMCRIRRKSVPPVTDCHYVPFGLASMWQLFQGYGPELLLEWPNYG